MKYTFFVLAIYLLTSCSKDEETTYVEENDKEIIEYIDTHKLNAKKSSSGLYYVIDKLGTGRAANSKSYVNVSYRGYLTNGYEFSKSDSEGIYEDLQKVIRGWSEGISSFKEGGSGK